MGINATPGSQFIHDLARVKPNTVHKNDSATQHWDRAPALGGWVVFVRRIGFHPGEIIDKMVSGGDIYIHMSRYENLDKNQPAQYGK